MNKSKKKDWDYTRTARSAAHLNRLTDEGGKPVRVDTSGDDLKLLDELVAMGYANNRAEAYRKAMRSEHGNWTARQELISQVRFRGNSSNHDTG